MTTRALVHWARARQQEAAIWLDDAYYALRRGGAVPGEQVGTNELPALAASRWKKKKDAPFHVLYVGHPTNWEPHNIPADPGLGGIVSTFWLADSGLGEVRGGVLVRRDEVGPAVAARIRELERSRPVHLVLGYLAGAHVRPEHVAEWSTLGIVSAAFHLDDRLYFRGPRKNGVRTGPADTARAFDLSLTNVRRSLTKYAAVGARAMFWPEAGNPAAFHPTGLERTHDIAFVGGRYGPRGDVVARLAAEGFSVLARGPGWPDGPVPAEEIPVVFSRGRIVLGFSGIGRSMRATCLKGRDFEAPMSGAAYLTSWNPELPLVWKVGEEIEVWRDVQDLKAKARSLLANPDRLRAIRSAAAVRARREHTWAHRIESIARVLGHPWRVTVGE